MPFVEKPGDPGPPVEKVGRIEIQTVHARDSRRGRALIVVEVDEGDTELVLAALRGLAGAERIERSSAVLETAVLAVERRT